MKRRIRILFVTDGLGNGGKERQLIETLKYLDRDKYLPGVLTFNTNQHYSKTAEELSGYYKEITKEKSTLEPFFSVLESYERFSPDITHTFDILSSIYTYIPSRIFGSKIVNASIQDVGLDKGWQRRIKKYLLAKSDIRIGNSVKGIISYGTEGDVLYNFIDMRRFVPRNPDNSFDAVMVANFTKYKDHYSFIEVMKVLLEKNILDNVYAVGDGDYLDEIEKITDNYDPAISRRIIFTGGTGNVEKILSTKSVGFLFSTEEYGEGISNSILEYMASGVIAIASDIGASDEIIENGKNGFLVDKRNTDMIISIVSRIKNDEEYAEEIRQNAYGTIAEKYSIEKNIRKLEELYVKLIQ